MKTKLTSIAPPVFITLSFVISRLLYRGIGLRFDNTPPGYFYQFVDPLLLRTRFLESIWYLHSQPPLFNFITGLLYQIFALQSVVFQLLFLILGLAFALVLYWLGLRLELKPWVSALLAVWFIVSPATVLYENLYFYTYPIAFMLTLSVFTLSKFLETGNFRWGFSFFSLLAGLCLTWAIFHLLWMLAVIGLIALFYRNWRELVIVSLLPVLIVTGWYTKNYLLFGTFSASSWAGMNMSHITFFSPLTPRFVREELAREGKISAYPVSEAFSSIRSYQDLIASPSARGIPVLDEPRKSKQAINFNNTFYIGLSNIMLRDALTFIRARPDLYLASVKQSFLIYFHSSSDYLSLKHKPTRRLESWWDRVFYGQISSYNGNFSNRWKNSAIYVGWWLVAMYVLAVFYGLKLIVADKKSDHAFLAVLAFMTFTIISFTLMSNFLDLAENNRFRFTLDPLVLLLFGRLIQDSLLKWVGRYRKLTTVNADARLDG